MHGYIFRKVEVAQEIDTQASHNWLNTGLSSGVEGYATALQKQEIPTKVTIKRRTKDLTWNRNADCVKIKKKPSSTYVEVAHLCDPTYTLSPDMIILQENLYEK